MIVVKMIASFAILYLCSRRLAYYLVRWAVRRQYKDLKNKDQVMFEFSFGEEKILMQSDDAKLSVMRTTGRILLYFCLFYILFLIFREA